MFDGKPPKMKSGEVNSSMSGFCLYSTLLYYYVFLVILMVDSKLIFISKLAKRTERREEAQKQLDKANETGTGKYYCMYTYFFRVLIVIETCIICCWIIVKFNLKILSSHAWLLTKLKLRYKCILRSCGIYAELN